MILLSLLACDGAPAPATPPPARFDAVTAAPKKSTAVADLCTESHADAASAKTFSLPTLDGPPMARGTGWTWLNMWATWCEPCVEEMPMLAKWQARLAKEGIDVALQFLSVDAKPDDLKKFQLVHPATPPTMHLANTSELATYLTTIGLDASAVIPIHLFVDPDQKIRCVRMGAVDEPEYDAVKQVLSGG
jgi:thiol-disulfide isomerase/thioredoxin